MVSSSKILTVSYGTFSCTAEGFEDPLAVVKETTHFFRGVVSNDRFFGAEPPQFDAELATEMMRAHLAQGADQGTLTLGKPATAASTGALSAALAAGPTRRSDAAPVAAPQAEAIALPDDDTIEATAVLTERVDEDDSVDLSPAVAVTDAPEVNLAALAQAVAASPVQPAALMADTAATPVARAMPKPAAPAAPEPVAMPAAEVPAPAPRPSNPESVAAKLDRIRAVVAANADDTVEAEPPRTAAPAAATAAVAAAAAATLPDSLFAEDDAEEVDDDALDALLGELRDEADIGAATAAVSDATLADTIASLMGGDVATDETEEDDTLATLLAEQAQAEDTTEEVFEDAYEDDFEDDSEDGDANGAIMADDSVEEDSFDADDDVLADETEDTADLDEAPVAADNLFADDAEDEPAPAPLRARVLKVKRADFLRAVEQGQLEEYEDEDDEDFGDDTAQDDMEPAHAAVPTLPLAEESTLSPEEEDELARELAAVKAELSGEFDSWDDAEDSDDDEDGSDMPAPLAARARPSAPAMAEDEDEPEDEEYDLEAARANARANGWDDEESYYDDDEDDDEDDIEAPAPLRLDNPVIPERETSRWPTDLDAIDARAAGKMGQPEHDHADDDADEDEEEDPTLAMIRDSARKTVKMASPARVLLTEREVEDDDTSRLMEQTDSEMDEPEGNRRRTAIAHLRAAVAATKADRLLGRKADAAEEQEPYREDLASVVRPRRPQATAATQRTERPADPAARPAPLKLVAEQRVITDAARTGAPSDLPRTVPVRPRRVSRVAEVPPREAEVTPISGDSTGFVAYAEEVGARELPELLEAAAAYMAYVEGRDQFSRPQLMSTVRLAEATESSREDRLRSFGQLLREGKIKKTAGGRFTASDRISFKPDRAAG